MDNPRYTPTDEEMKSLSSLLAERSIPKLNQVTLSYIEKVTENVTVNVDMVDSAINRVVSIDGTYVYLPIGTTRNSLASSSGINKNCINFVNSASKNIKYDEKINLGETVFFNVGEQKTEEYTVKLPSDQEKMLKFISSKFCSQQLVFQKRIYNS